VSRVLEAREASKRREPVMPRHKSRNDYQKFYRPNGMRYATGEAEKLTDAINTASVNFVKEFGWLPDIDHCQYHAFHVTGKWVAELLEIDSAQDPRDQPARGRVIGLRPSEIPFPMLDIGAIERQEFPETKTTPGNREGWTCKLCVKHGCPTCHKHGERCPCVRDGRT
jgi:hypothetical protein